MLYDLAIIGGGPAGAAAGVYAARKRLKALLLTKEWGGQSVVSPDIQNWVGAPSISGLDLAKSLKSHVEKYKNDTMEIREGVSVKKIEKVGSGFNILTDSGENFEAKTVLLATGSQRRKLEIPGADVFEHKGLTYCASCDGPLFSGLDTAVIGGGNAGFETAAQLLAYAKSVTILHKHKEPKADDIIVSKVLENPRAKFLGNTEPTKILGDKFVTGLKYKDVDTGEEKELSVSGIFVEIGLLPSTSLVKGLVDLNEVGQIKVDPRTGATNVPGIWAAGDSTDALYHQNNIAAGDAVRALENIYLTLHTRS